MKAQTIICFELPQGSYAVGALEDKAIDPLLLETCSDSKP
jgi:hypothetical protein